LQVEGKSPSIHAMLVWNHLPMVSVCSDSCPFLLRNLYFSYSMGEEEVPQQVTFLDV
jgi:hypothetical protein